MKFEFADIGVIHSPFQEPDQVPIQSARSDARGEVEIYSQYGAGLDGIEGFSHLILFYIFHKSANVKNLKVMPFLDDQEYGIFATRYPDRPNQLGFSVVKLLERQGNRLLIQGLDVLDGTPLLDIKPYFPDFDVFEVQKIGWYEKRAFR